MSYVVYAGNTTSYVGFTMPSDNYVAMQFEYLAESSEAGGMVASTNASGSFFRGLIQDANTANSSSADQIEIDDAAAIFRTRDELHSALHDGNWHKVRVLIYGKTGLVTGNNSHLTGEVIRFGAYVASNTFCAAAQLKNFKIKLGAQSSPTDWDFESELGDTNGFSQNNVTEVIEETGSPLANMIQQHAAMGYL